MTQSRRHTVSDIGEPSTLLHQRLYAACPSSADRRAHRCDSRPAGSTRPTRVQQNRPLSSSRESRDQRVMQGAGQTAGHLATVEASATRSTATRPRQTAARRLWRQGPIARKLDLNSGDNLFGPGWRANATIGRAVRLIMRNVIGTLPGELDRSSLGHGGKYSYCIAENETDSPWPALHTTRGFKADQSAVTIFAAFAPHQYSNGLSAKARRRARNRVRAHENAAGAARKHDLPMVFPASTSSFSKTRAAAREDVQRYVYENTKNTVGGPEARPPGAASRHEDERTPFPLVEDPQDLLVIAAGGPAGVQSAFIPGWGGKAGSRPVTKEIRLP